MLDFEFVASVDVPTFRENMSCLGCSNWGDGLKLKAK